MTETPIDSRRQQSVLIEKSGALFSSPPSTPGVTVCCPGSVAADTVEVDEMTDTKVTCDDLDATTEPSSTACRTNITDMSHTFQNAESFSGVV